MQINLVWDSSVNSAPAAFKTAVSAAAAYLNQLITNNITVNIQVGYGEDAGSRLTNGTLAEGGPSDGTYLTYAQLKAALTANATSAADASVLANLPAGDPTNGGQFYVSSSQEKAWGLIPATGTSIDGAVGFSSTVSNFNYDTTNRAVAGQYDFMGVAIHEITHALDRYIGTTVNRTYDPMDLFRYSAPGVLQISPSVSGYFSVDGGKTDLKPLDTTSDYSDWASSVTNDSFDAYANTGAVLAVSSADITLLDVRGYTVASGSLGPSIGGTTAGQAIVDQQTILPFAGVSISDLNINQTETVTVTLSAAANGKFSNLGGGSYNPVTGVYTVTGSATQVTAALDGLVFAPALGQVTQGQTLTTGFTIGVTDTAGGTASDTTASVITAGSGQNLAIPLTSGTQPSGGSFTGAGTIVVGGAPVGWIGNASATDVPATDSFTAWSGTMAEEIVAVQGANTGAIADTIFQNKTLTALGAPFAAQGMAVQGNAAISTADSAATDDIRYTFSSAVPAGASFLLWSPGGQENGKTGPYTFTFTAKLNGAVVSTAGWTFSVLSPTGGRPIATYATNAATGQVTVSNYSGTTTFPDAVIVATTNAKVDFVDVTASTIPYDVWGLAIAGTTPAPPQPQPAIAGTAAGQKTTDNGTISPFAHVTVTDAVGDATETAVVSLSPVGNGTLSNLGGGSYNAATGVYSVTGSAAAVTSALDGLVFTPTPHQVAPGNTVTTTFGLKISDGAGATATDTSTTVVTTATAAACTIAGTVAGQTTTDVATVKPFSKASLIDPNAGQTETVTVTLSKPDNGALTNLGIGGFDDDTGIYTATGSAAAVTAALQGLVFVPTVHQVAAGKSVTTGFTVKMTDTAGVSVSDSTTSVTVSATSGAASTAGIAAAYAALCQAAPAAAYQSSVASQIDTGGQTTSQFEASLLTSPAALSSVLPSLIVIDAFYGVTPSYSVLSSVSGTVQGWGTLNGMTTADQWSVLGMQFAHNGTFGAMYGALDNNAFAGQIYQAVFGTAPSVAVQKTLANEVTSLAAAYKGYDPVHSDVLGGKGAVYAALLYYAETTQQGHFYNAANTFLINQMNTAFSSGAAPVYSQGAELTRQFPSAMSVGAAAREADPTIISVSNATVDPGMGEQAIRFLAGAANDALVLHAGATDTITGFDMNAGDALDFHALLAEAHVTVADVTELAAQLSVVQQGSDALVTFQQAGVALLQGLGGVVLAVDDLVRHNALRV